MYTIKQASSRSGVAVATIRAWERRYGVIQPRRTPAGYRLYDEPAIERLVAMRRLVDDGWQASVAAAELAERARGGTPEVAVAASVVGAERPFAGAGATVDAAAEISRRFVDAAAAIDEIALDRVLDDLFARGSFERALRDHLFPALRALGDAWAAGEVSVAGEHLASHGVLRRLAQALDAAGRGEPGSGHVVVGLPPGARHELGALAFAVALRRAGVPVAYLGPDLPLADWVGAAGGAAAAVIGVVTTRDRRPAREVADRLRSEAPGTLVAVGGRAASGAAGAVGALAAPGIVVLPAATDDAVTALIDALRARSAAGPSGD